MARIGYCKHGWHVGTGGSSCPQCWIEADQQLKNDLMKEDLNKKMVKEKFLELLNDDIEFAMAVKNLLGL